MAAREEDKAMAGLLRRSLAQDAGAPSVSGDCPEPEIIAAYFDRALDAQETVRYDLHFSRCSVCREQLAAMARAGGVADADGAEKKTVGAWVWLTGPRWLMPAAAMVVALLAITGIFLRARKPVAPGNEIAMSRPDALPPGNSAPVTNSAPEARPSQSPEKAPATGAASNAPATTDKMVARPSTPAASRLDTERAPIAGGSPGEPAASRELGLQSPSRTVSRLNTGTRGGELSRVGEAAGGVGAKSAAAPVRQPQKLAPQTSPGIVRGAMRAGNSATASGVAAANGSGGGAATANSGDHTAAVIEAAPPQDAAESTSVVLEKASPEKKAEADSAKSDVAISVEAEAAPQPNARKARSAATASTAGKAGAAPPPPAAQAMNLAASQTTGPAALAKMQQAQISSNLMNLQVQTPDPKILWMIAGAIEKSEDGGATWRLEYPETRAQIIAGSAPNVKICWLVGEHGTILRTTNGAHWKSIKPPEETDFVRVEATDALNATVTALDGRRFSTSDGGKSWNNVQ
jgi:hypothetical protein